MMRNYIYINLCNDKNIASNNLRIKLVNKCNKIVFDGMTDCFGKIKIPICDDEVYRLIVYSNLAIIKIPMIAKTNNVYSINISNKRNVRKHLVTLCLMDANYPNLKIEGGKMTIWQDIRFP